MNEAKSDKVIIIGAGPAGLTAAFELNKLGKKSIILESSDSIGGISQTVNYKGNRFDIGGHRFFSKVKYVNEIWSEILEDDLLTRPRLSRIHYNGKFFDYPLKPLNALKHLGPFEAVRVGLSYAKTIVFPSKVEKSFEDWVVNRFGRRLFEIFFETYTEKVWGISCKEISSDWAAQRIKNLSLKSAVTNAILGASKSNGEIVTTLIEQFKYPRLGPGMMWEKCVQILDSEGSYTHMNQRANKVYIQNNQVTGIGLSLKSGDSKMISSAQYISSMPLRELILSMEPLPEENIVTAAKELRYRDYLTVVLIVNKKEVFPDNWIYIHSPQVKLGRIQNYKNWSGEMVENSDYTVLGLEYFLWEKDEEWEWSNEKLIELGHKECQEIGILESEEVVDATVIRMKKAYPVYDHNYTKNVTVIKDYINQISNLQTIGRNGQHRYNNQDHSMMTGVYAARNILGANYDVWSVNVEKEYHEEGDDSNNFDRLIPQKIVEKDQIEDESLPFENERLTSLDPIALGGSVGITMTLILVFSTLILIFKGGDVVAPNLSLLNNYLIGFDISFKGLLIGAIEMLIIGFTCGYLVAWLRNKCFELFIIKSHTEYTRQLNKDILEKI